MKRHPALYILSHDHHQGLILAQQLKKNAPQYKGLPSTAEGRRNYAVAFYNTELKKHFKAEEEILFPAAEGKSIELDKLIDDIIKEHREIAKLVHDLTSSQDTEKIMDELGCLLEGHIRKEERMLFIEIENILSETELNEIQGKLKHRS